jgi:hypothetical protein
MSNSLFLFGIVSEILAVALPIIIFLGIETTIKSLKMPTNEARKLSLFFPACFVPIFLFLIIILDLGSWFNLYYVLAMADWAIVLTGGGAAFYLQHLVNPRLKRDYGFTYEFFRKSGHGFWKSLDQFEEYKK